MYQKCPGGGRAASTHRQRRWVGRPAGRAIGRNPLRFSRTTGTEPTGGMTVARTGDRWSSRGESCFMLLVDTELRPSLIHGLGTFLLEPVRKGQVIWRFDSRIDRIYSEEELATLPPHMQRFLRTYSTWHDGMKV